MNKEILPYYDKKGKRLGLMERKEIHKKGLINKHVAYLINDEHGWILQLRNKDKSQNPNVWDKPGGHYNVNDDFSREFIEEICHELPVSGLVLSKKEYLKKYSEYDLKKNVVMYHHSTILNFRSTRILQDGTSRIETLHLELFVGAYHGKINPQPSEVQKIKSYSKAELEKLIANTPEKVGPDTIYLYKHFKEVIYNKLNNPE